MPFAVPTLSQVVDDARSELNRLPGADSRLRRTLLDTLAVMVGGAAWALYGFAAWISRQIFADTAELEQLERIAAVWGLLRISATFASGNVDVVGTTGAIVPLGTEFRRSDGTAYLSNADTLLSSGAATVAVTAAVPGDAGNALAATAISLVSPLEGVAPDATVSTGGLIGGANEESDDAFRARLLERIRTPPQGGSNDDYITWSLAALVGVTRVWVSSPTPGAVLVLFVMDGGGGAGGILPSSPQIITVQDYIDDSGRRPVTASVTVAAPATTAVAFTIHLITADTAEIRAAIAAELVDLFKREGSPGGTILLSHIREAISGARGEIDHTLTVPSANVVCSANHIPILGTITWA